MISSDSSLLDLPVKLKYANLFFNNYYNKKDILV